MQTALTELPKALAAEGYGTPSYRAVYEAARSAIIPATRGNNGRWVFDPTDLPIIADRLGLRSGRSG
jgi:copper homeostasis protein CutC